MKSGHFDESNCFSLESLSRWTITTEQREAGIDGKWLLNFMDILALELVDIVVARNNLPSLLQHNMAPSRIVEERTAWHWLFELSSYQVFQQHIWMQLLNIFGVVLQIDSQRNTPTSSVDGYIKYHEEQLSFGCNIKIRLKICFSKHLLWQ